MEKKKRKKILHKLIAYLLIAGMLIGMNPMQVSATAASTVNEETPDNGDTSNTETPDSGDTLNTETPDSGDTSNTDTPDNGDTSNTDGVPGGEETGSGEETENDGEQSEDKSESEEDDETGEETDETGEENAEETDEADEENAEETDEVDEENLEEDEFVATAESAFAGILAQKDIMALIYLTDVYHVRSQADEESETVAELGSGHTVYLRGVTITESQIWYRVRFFVNGVEQEGYVLRDYLAYSDEDWRAWENEYLNRLVETNRINSVAIGGISAYSTSYADIECFPAGYQSALIKLKDAHPNWIFVPMNTKLDFNTVVSKQMVGDRSLIQKTTSNASKGWVGAACPSESGWYYATEDAVAYYLNPCNFLTETYIFQFEQLTFNASYHSADAVQSFLNSTFMSGTIPGDSRTYAQAFYEIGKDKKLSPIHLASRVYQEQGQGKSDLISGTYGGYEGYYNYFNVGVYGSSTTEKVVRGLTYAKNMGWNTRFLSLQGGASTIGNNYILKYQDTIYLEKFNVDSNSPYGLYNHQYMQNIQAPASEATTTKKMYTNAGSLNSAFVFKIPVYNNMPGLKLDKTQVTVSKGQSVTLTASVNGTNLDGTQVTWTSDDTSVATVSNGTITAQGVGTANITAACDGNAVVCKVTVDNHLSGISFGQEEYVLRRTDTVLTDGENLSVEADGNIDTITLQVIFEPEDTTDDKTIVWTSSNKKVATVDANGVVKAIATGETTITAKATKAGNKTTTCKIKVIAPIYQMELTNAAESDTILIGQSVNLTAEYWPKNTTSSTEIVWSSSDTKVATVTKGKVEGIGAGTATIRAEAAGYFATYDITVEESTVTFMDSYQNPLKTMKVVYGQQLIEEDFPEIEVPEEQIFIGWYTKEDGAGTKVDTETQIFQKETVLYPYFEISSKGFYVVPVGDQTYTGSAIKPKIQVYDGISYEDGSKELILLEQNKDYTVSYKNNTNVNGESKNKPTITVKGKGNYAGTEYVYFNIIPKQLTDTDITVSNLTAAYTGKVIKNNPVVSRNGKRLAKNKDYTVTYPQTGTGAYQKAGTYPIVITGKGGYTGTLTIYETITADVLMSKVSIAKIPNMKYDDALVDKENGIGIEPDGLVVTYKDKRLEESTDGINGDYTVKYYNNMVVGTATATITAVEGSGYTGSKSITYKITGTSIAKVKITGIEAKTYTGIESDMWQNNVVLTLNGEELTLSTDGGITGDYVVSYLNTHKVGNATIIFKGVNEYTGTIRKTYRINAFDFSADALTESPSIKLQYYTEDNKENIHNISSVNEITASYMKGGTKPMVLLCFNDIALVYGKDYTIAYKNNNAVTTENMKANKLPTITITGKGNYKGKITGNFLITDGDMSDGNGKIIMTAKDVVYKNKKDAYKTTVVLTDANGKNLQAGKDYEKTLIYTYAEDTFLCGTDGGIIVRKVGDMVENTDIPDAGTTIKITVKGKGAYAGGETPAELSTTYHITAADISKVKVKVSAKVYNNGRPVTLTEEDLVLTMNGTTLKLGEDYVIDETTYTNNTKKGKATVVLRGTGSNYGGTKTVTFTIGSKTLVWWKNLL